MSHPSKNHFLFKINKSRKYRYTNGGRKIYIENIKCHENASDEKKNCKYNE